MKVKVFSGPGHHWLLLLFFRLLLSLRDGVSRDAVAEPLDLLAKLVAVDHSLGSSEGLGNGDSREHLWPFGVYKKGGRGRRRRGKTEEVKKKSEEVKQTIEEGGGGEEGGLKAEKTKGEGGAMFFFSQAKPLYFCFFLFLFFVLFFFIPRLRNSDSLKLAL